MFCISRESIEKEPAADVGSSSVTADVVSARPVANVGSIGPAADVGSSEVLVGTKVIGKKVEKGLKEKQKIKRVIQQWKKQFKSNSLSIKIVELKEFLKEHNLAGHMFKRNFVVLCVSTLMDGKIFIFILLIFSYS